MYLHMQAFVNITIEVEYARHIVGKGSRKLKTLKDTYDINISTSNDNNNNLILTATGRHNNIQKAFTEIRTTIDIQKESNRELENKQSKYGGKPCREFKVRGTAPEEKGAGSPMNTNKQHQHQQHTEKK